MFPAWQTRAKWIPALLLLTIPGVVTGLRAEVRPAALFSDHMVLQQGATLPVWGTASPGETVTVRLAGRVAETRADASGYWRVTLRPLPPSFTPQTLVIEGRNRIEISDVLLGDVWICAGEGNMEFPLSRAASGRETPSRVTDLGLRLFTVRKRAAARPDRLGGGSWEICTATSSPAFSAVGYFFARDLRSTAQNIPIGVIDCSWKDTPAASWVSSRGLRQSPPFTAQLAAFSAQRSLLEGALPGSDERQRTVPSALFNGMVSPLIPYAITGLIWYQGESDEGAGAFQYRRLFPRLIRDWRAHWGQGPFPFYFVCLAGFGAEGGASVEPYAGEGGTVRRGWAWIREAQSEALHLPNTGMAVATDLGDPNDRLPPGKLDVGRRLALLARHRVYGEKVTDKAPVCTSVKTEGNRIRLEFAGADGVLTLGVPPWQPDGRLPAPATQLRGFAVAGEDRRWQAAQGRIEGGSIVLWSDAVPRPVAARYNWKGFCDGNLYSKDGLPVAPFRTDHDQPR